MANAINLNGIPSVDAIPSANPAVPLPDNQEADPASKTFEQRFGTGYITSDEAEAANAPETNNGINLSGIPFSNPEAQRQQVLEQKYGTPGQQALTILEGAGRGLTGPIIPGLEVASGLTTGRDMRMRQQVNPVESGASEAGAFIGSELVPGLGEYTLANKVGKLGDIAQAGGRLINIGGKEAGLVSKIASTGIRGSAEMAALAASDQTSNLITRDPNQSVQLSTIGSNLGLSMLAGAAIGGVGGAAFGVVSPLWKTTKNLIGIDKAIADFMGENNFLSKYSTAEPEALAQDAAGELTGRMKETDMMRNTLGEAKPEVLQKAMPEPTLENAQKIDAQLSDIHNNIQEVLEKAAGSVKTRNAVQYPAEDFANWKNIVTNPDATFAEKYAATDQLKRNLDEYANYNLDRESTALGQLGRDLANPIRAALEDTKVWGAAGDVQRITNEATTNAIRATNDLKAKLTSKLQLTKGEVDPNALQSLIKNAMLGKGNVKADVARNYLESTQAQADAIAKVHLDNGLESPLAAKLNPTPTLNHILETPVSPGTNFARWLRGQSPGIAGSALSKLGAGAVGGLLGHATHIPFAGFFGALAAEKVLAPALKTLAVKLADRSINSVAAKGTMDYVGAVIRGKNLLDKAADNIFERSALVIGKNLIPDQESRDSLEKIMAQAKSNPNSLLNVGNDLSHYMPDHATAAATVTAAGLSYLESLKPSQPLANPLDTPPPVDKAQQAKFDRALDIAQQPLMVMQHVKDGTLQAQDMTTMQTIYPDLLKSMINQVTSSLIAAKTEGKQIPYKTKLSLGLLMGAPLDSTMTAVGLQAIMASARPAVQPQGGGGKQKKTSSSTLEQMSKVNDMYATPLQARAVDRRENS